MMGMLLRMLQRLVEWPLIAVSRMIGGVVQALMACGRMVATALDRVLGGLLRRPAGLLFWVIQHWTFPKWRDLMLGMPALLGLLTTGALVLVATIQDQSLSQEYLLAARQAGKQQDYERAEFLMTRVLQRGGREEAEAQFEMAMLLDDLGQKQRAAQLFRLLAPDNQRAPREVHRRMALILAEQVHPGSDAKALQRFHWHLTGAADETSPHMALAWGRYCLAVSDLSSARRYMGVAVAEFPQLWKTLAVLDYRLDDRESALNSCEQAARYLSAALAADPRNDSLRADYVEVLMMRGRLNEAATVLNEGRLYNPDGPWPRLECALAVNQHDRAVMDDRPVAELLGHLAEALHHDSSHGPALLRLLSYSATSAVANSELREILETALVEGRQPAMVHLTLGNLCWKEGNSAQARFHYESALSVRPDLAAVLNNLAWLLAHQEPAPELERAMELVTAALQQQPDHADFLDTRGTILLLQNEWAAALADLEQALSGVEDQRAVHRKLGEIYEQLGNESMAARHRLLARSAAEVAP